MEPDPTTLTDLAASLPTFAELGLGEPPCHAAGEVGLESPTALQANAIPHLLAGRDAYAIAPPGSGRTLAWVLPSLQRIDPAQEQPQLLVVTPNRQRCLALAATLSALGQRLGLGEALPLHGERPIEVQRRLLERASRIIVGTPSRLAELFDSDDLSGEALEVVVLDEAGELDAESTDELLDGLDEETQLLVFSSTENDALRQVIDFLEDPVELTLESPDLDHPPVQLVGHDVPRHEKPDTLARLLEQLEEPGALIFAGRSTGVVELADWLTARGFNAMGLRANLPVETRGEALDRLACGELEALVVTDAAVRELAHRSLPMVVHYDAAPDAITWTARDVWSSDEGSVAVLRAPQERMLMNDVQRQLGVEIHPSPVPRGSEGSQSEMVRLFLSAGRRDGIRPGDVVGAISNEADIPGSSIGSIDIYDRFTFVDVLASEAERVQESMSGKTLRGRAIEVRPATPRNEGQQGGYGGDRSPRATSNRGGAAPQPEGPLKVLVVELGYRDGVRPGELVAAIAEETEIPGRVIGSIDIADELTFIEIPEDDYDHVLERMQDAQIRGRDAHFRLPTEEELQDELAVARGPRRERSVQGPEPGMARLFVSAGHNVGIRPADVVGAIAGDADIPGKDIGSIDIYDRYSFVEVPEEVQDHVLERMEGASLRGRSVEFRKATPRGSGGTERESREPRMARSESGSGQD